MAKKILIAEDEKPMASALKAKFTGEGFEVKNAYNGDEALKLLAKEKFDLLLLDLIMPQKDGFEVLEELKKKNNKITVIVSSNLSQGEDKTRAEELGAKGFFVKSDTPIKEVVKYVKKALKI